MLRKERHPNLDFFLADIWVWPIKDDHASMEHPIFSLTKKPTVAIRHYERNGITVTVAPSAYGMPTIWDKDVLIYCCSQLIEGMKQGREPHAVVRFEVYDLLVSTNRSTGKKGYDLLKDALDRLHGVNVKTNIKTGGTETTYSFHLIDEWSIVEAAANASVQVRLSDWLYRAVINHEVLTLHKDYFRLDGGLERRLYELCRKHCGNQSKWIVRLETLHEKSGSQGPLKKFRHVVRNLVASDHLPEYRLRSQGNLLVVYPRTHKGGLRELKDVLGID
jgi:plasmid replication initiation protein